MNLDAESPQDSAQKKTPPTQGTANVRPKDVKVADDVRIAQTLG